MMGRYIRDKAKSSLAEKDSGMAEKDSGLAEKSSGLARKSSSQIRNVWLAALVLYIGIIYGHSLMPASISSRESGFLLVKLYGWMDGLGLESGWLTEHIIRKTAHFTEYAGLGCLLYINGGMWFGGWQRMRTTLEMAFLVPFADETIQLFAAGRSGQISDVWLDLCGVMCGLAAAGVVSAVRHRKKKDGEHKR